jgi:predicted transcriptional regulator
MTRMSEMHAARDRAGHRNAETSGASSELPIPGRTVVIDVDRKLAQRLDVLARWKGVSEEDLLAAAIEQHPRNSAQRSLSIQVSEVAAVRLAAAAATVGMSEEELIAEAIDAYMPQEKAARFWPILAFHAVVIALPLVLMFLSPRIGPSASSVEWTFFALAMLACCTGAGVLVAAVIYAEWMVVRYGIKGLVSAAVCGAVAVLSAFAYGYWLLSSLRPASLNLPLSRVDAVYFTLGTFTTTGTGRLAPHSAPAELLVCLQVVLGFGFVAVLLALLIPRAVAAYKSRSYGRIVVRAGS